MPCFAKASWDSLRMTAWGERGGLGDEAEGETRAGDALLPYEVKPVCYLLLGGQRSAEDCGDCG